jgi:hypothetical protein
MSIQPIAANVSANAPLAGQKSRSSQNFRFLNLPTDGSNITVTTVTGITFRLNKDVSHGNDENIGTFSNQSQFDSSKVNTSDNYYIASPTSATQNFEVTFTGDV